ncbi:MAG: hypothetical protein A2X13_09445 [Bacteroidetes bacterium GWC2_33_15]|nr:MAG: hypothetical protein A2X13_09445 [Bacteroidetes bacterium GWC2_33_15]HAN19238.1 hypothetical protein [Bacteroidales bacterium]
MFRFDMNSCIFKININKRMKTSYLQIIFVLSFLICCFTGIPELKSQEIDTSETQKLFDLSLDDLMNIEIVSAVGKSQNIKEAPSIVTVITSKQIKQRGYQSVAEALNSTAGIDIITDYFQPNMGIRGINGGVRSWSRLVKVMIDGQSISLRSSSDNFLDQSLIPIEVIDKIEIIRGPNSAIYGKNAFLGVINIITKKGSEETNNAITHFAGSFANNATYGISTVFGGENKYVDFLFASTYSHYDYSGLTPANIPGSQIYTTTDLTEQNESSPFSIYSKIHYENEKIGEFILDLSHQDINHKAEFADWGALTHHNRINVLNAYERLQYSKTLFDNFDSHLSIAHSHSKPLNNEILDNDNNHSDWISREFKTTSYEIGGNISYNSEEKSSFTLGVDYTADINDYQKYYTINSLGDKTLNPGGSTGPRNFNNTGVYLQMILNPGSFFKLDFLNNLTLTAGYRFDFHTIYDDVLTYRLAAVYQIANQLSTKLMYGTSFNAPSPAQLYTNAMYPGDIIGNPDLKPERAKTLEWAIMGKIIDNLNFNTNLFYTVIEDKIEYLLPFGEITNITAANISKIYSAGIEAEVNYSYMNSLSYFNYSYQRSIIERTNPLYGLIKVKTALYPEHIFKFGETYAFPKLYTRVHIEGKYISSRKASEQNSFIYDPINYSIHSYNLDPYFLVGVTLESMNLNLFNNKESIISIKMDNLLNSEYNYPGFDDYDIPGLGRSLIFKLTQTL